MGPKLLNIVAPHWPWIVCLVGYAAVDHYKGEQQQAEMAVLKKEGSPYVRERLISFEARIAAVEKDTTSLEVGVKKLIDMQLEMRDKVNVIYADYMAQRRFQSSVTKPQL